MLDPIVGRGRTTRRWVNRFTWAKKFAIADLADRWYDFLFWKPYDRRSRADIRMNAGYKNRKT